MNSIEILTDLAQRPGQAADALPKLSADQLNDHLGGHPNSVAWLLWHSGREVDVQLTDLTGQPEQWERFRDRFDLGEAGDGFGLGHTPEQAAQIRVENQQLLVDYLKATLNAFTEYLNTLTEADLDEVIDENWTPVVTRGVRLVSIIDDAAQHVGQAAFVAGAFT
ncbi:mycothiol transferase [Brevibacterium spongiae]|uniref:DinB family protein n=1 Tax=Brevibacterium spongiae TaxID=2909672 RepID=A0ABY5SWG4_9MICO|nr:DinB family protein [Brevibacterium spongiae]UVI37488.1 DinB family protein [Brevibacterium spongiae]